VVEEFIEALNDAGLTVEDCYAASPFDDDDDLPF
jgi:hypothetical protein